MELLNDNENIWFLSPSNHKAPRHLRCLHKKWEETYRLKIAESLRTCRTWSAFSPLNLSAQQYSAASSLTNRHSENILLKALRCWRHRPCFGNYTDASWWLLFLKLTRELVPLSAETTNMSEAAPSASFLCQSSTKGLVPLMADQTTVRHHRSIMKPHRTFAYKAYPQENTGTNWHPLVKPPWGGAYRSVRIEWTILRAQTSECLKIHCSQLRQRSDRQHNASFTLYISAPPAN